MTESPKVYIIIYSLYHHIYKMSLAIKEGLEANGIDAQMFQVQETLSDQVLEKMHAPAKPDLPVIEVNQLADADGLIFGIPTRFGIFPAQMKALLDASGQLWAKGSLAGKFVATFFSTAAQHGGQETTALNAVTYFAHHGLIYVPFGYASSSMMTNDEVIGGSAYGAGTITNGDGSRQPSEIELAMAKNQADNYAKVLNTYHKGRKRLTSTSGADSDASVRSLKAASHNTLAANNNGTPLITTTDPEGQTQEQHGSTSKPTENVVGTTAGGAAAIGAGAAGTGAGAAAAASKKEAPQAQQEATPRTRQEPKKKKKWYMFCCSSD